MSVCARRSHESERTDGRWSDERSTQNKLRAHKDRTEAEDGATAGVKLTRSPRPQTHTKLLWSFLHHVYVVFKTIPDAGSSTLN